MKYLRHEVRLHPGTPAENELIKILEQQGDVYGAKTKLMREWIVRGFIALTQKMQAISKEGNELAALDLLAQALIGGDYQVVKTYLEARKKLEQEASESKADKNEELSSATSDQVLTIEPPVALEPNSSVSSSLIQVEATHTTETESMNSPIHDVAENRDSEEVRPKAAVDWSKLRALAGTSHKKNV